MLSNVTNASTDTQRFLETYNLSVYIVIMIVGLVWNVTLMIMFARHKEIRTVANIMIFNLAISDVLNVSVVVLLRYKYHYSHGSPDNVDLCKGVLVFQNCVYSASAMSLVALSIQRYCVSVPHSKFHIRLITNTTLITTIYILFIWILSLLVPLPFGIVPGIYEYMCGNNDSRHDTEIMIMFEFIYYGIFLPCLMFFFNFGTARRMKNSTINFIGGINSRTLELARTRSAKVVMVLSVLFLLTHLPHLIWCVCAYCTEINRRSATMLILESITKHLMFLDSCFHPLALYMTSSTFRKLFRRYLCCSKEKRQVIFSLQHGSPSTLEP